MMGDYGTPVKKLVRRNDPDTSRIAARSVDTSYLERLVHEIISSFGEDGCISEQVLNHPRAIGKPYSSITARFKALMEKGMIRDTGERRCGASNRPMRVMVSSNATRSGRRSS